MIVAESPTRPPPRRSIPDVVRMKSANVDVLVQLRRPPKFVAQGSKVAELGWKPMHIVGITGVYDLRRERPSSRPA